MFGFKTKQEKQLKQFNALDDDMKVAAIVNHGFQKVSFSHDMDAIVDKLSRLEKINLMQKFYLHYLVEDGNDGTNFDLSVLDVLRDLKDQYEGQ